MNTEDITPESTVPPAQTEESTQDSAGDESLPRTEAPPVLSRFQRREKAAADALHTLFRDFYLERFGKEPDAPQPLSMKFDVQCVAGGDWHLEFSPPLFEQLQNQLEDLGSPVDVYVAGHVYDFFEETSNGTCCMPPTPLSVFKSYDSKGIPCWHDLTQALLQSGDDRTAQLYDRTPRILASMIYGKELHKEQLRSYGRSSRSYSILGQVIAGYHQLPATMAIQGDRRLAITLQIVETRGCNRDFQLKLNLLSYLNPEKMQDLLANERSGGLARSIAIAKRDVEKLEQQVRSARKANNPTKASELMRRVPAILRNLCNSVERNHRQTTRRTRHAEDRRPQRPIHKALEDALAVRSDRFYYDIKHESWIIVGDAGRTHAFNTEGRHITSFIIKPDSIGFRIRTERWRETTPEEFSRFSDIAKTPQTTPNR